MSEFFDGEVSDVCPDCGMPAHDDDWSECVRLLRDEVARLRAVVAATPPVQQPLLERGR